MINISYQNQKVLLFIAISAALSRLLWLEFVCYLLCITYWNSQGDVLNAHAALFHLSHFFNLNFDPIFTQTYFMAMEDLKHGVWIWTIIFGAFCPFWPLCFQYVVEKNNVNILLNISFCAPWKKENVNDMNVIKWFHFCKLKAFADLDCIFFFSTGDASRPGWTDIITTVTVAKMAHFRIVNCWNRKLTGSGPIITFFRSSIYWRRTPLLTFRPRHSCRQYVCLRKFVFDLWHCSKCFLEDQFLVLLDCWRVEMFTALKKLVGSEAGQLRDRHIPAGLQSMNQSLQRRFAKGVQYNSKSFMFNLIFFE